MQAADILHLSGAVIAGAYFAVILFAEVKNKKALAGAGLIAVACFFIALMGVSLMRNIIYVIPPQSEPFSVYREYYLTMVIFAAGYALFARAFGVYAQTTGAAAESLIIFSFISRVACCITGCCGGKAFGGISLPLPYFELAFAAAAFIVMRAARVKDKLGAYVLAYSVYRFAVEFLRENGGIRTYGGMNIRQYIALTVIGIAAVYFIVLMAQKSVRRRYKYEHKE